MDDSIDRSYSRRPRWRLDFGISISIAGIIAFIYIAYTSVLGYKSQYWPMTSGVLIATNDSKSIRSNDYTINVEYQYTVKGIPYTGTRISYPNRAVSGEDNFNAEIRKLVSHPSLSVYYDPENPERACLEPGMDGFYAFFLGPFSILCSIFGWTMYRITPERRPD
jgi:hypothetical protein